MGDRDGRMVLFVPSVGVSGQWWASFGKRRMGFGCFSAVADGFRDAWVVWAWIHYGMSWLYCKYCVYVCMSVFCFCFV